jgi:hypothetical protein
MTLGSLRRRLGTVVSVPASTVRRETRQSGGRVCRVTVDLRRMSQVRDPEAAGELLRGAPGVLDVRVDVVGGRAVVLHDSRTSFPQLWNWLLAQSGPQETHG